MPFTEAILTTFVIVVILLTVLLFFIARFISLYQKRHQGFMNTLEETKMKFNEELLQTKLEVQEQTLENISRELHDNVGQHFTVAKLHLNTIDIHRPDQAAVKIRQAVDLLTQGLNDLRDVSKSLSLDLIRSNGLEKAIKAQVEVLERSGHFRVEYTVVGNYNYSDETKEIIVFRIFQEAITNIIRHAEASGIQILLDCSVKDKMTLVVRDDGQGFDVTKHYEENGSRHSGGLVHMRTRAGLVEAVFSVYSQPGAGTEIILSVPLPAEYEPSF